MTAIEQIIDELSDSERSLINPLLKTKVLATRIGNNELSEWTDNELRGYSEKELPSYRLGKAFISCTLQQGNVFEENVPLPIMLFERDFIDKLLRFKFNESIQTLENQERSNKNGILYNSYGPDMCAFMTQKINESGHQISIKRMDMTVQVSQITQLLAEVRAKLLDFMLKVEKKFPNLEELVKDKLVVKEKVNEKIEQIYHQTIINTSGYGNTITSGVNNIVTSNIEITQGNYDELRLELEKNHVPAQEIEELIIILQTEHPDKSTGHFGERVNSWIQKMLSKTLDGTWQIGTGAAGGMLVEYIKNFYGM